MELNENYRITHDSENVILQFHEMREKQVLVTEEGKETKTYQGTGEFKEFTENYYYPGLESALKGFLRKCTWGTEKAEEILAKLDAVHETIKNINKN
jgi:hypothetical protein